MTAKSRGLVEPADTMRVSMLRMANAWRATGQINQAIDTYLQLLERFPGSAEAREAVDNIQSLAQTYERQGRYHLALSLHKKLEQLSWA